MDARESSRVVRSATADRFAFLIDGEEYFPCLANALESARRSILIVGWDLHSRVRLRPDDPDSELSALLDRAAEAHPELEAHLLCWDFSAIYALEREFLTRYRLGWNSHGRVHFQLDNRHPTGACHHQKLVVIDDRLAFVGGFDITARRWDRSEHAPEDPCRVEPNGAKYRPFHDVQTLVSGEAARRVGDIVRERWRRATGSALPGAASDDSGEGELASWPRGLDPAARDVTIGLALTEPEFESCAGRAEIEALYLQAIERARETIYIENQFVSSAAVCDALARRLAESDPPEVVIVRPRELFNWLETATMGVLCNRAQQRLEKADRHGRLRVYFPRNGEASIGLHSKVCIVDDDFLTVGSANVANRSMRLDTECNLFVDDSAGDTVKELVSELRGRLLSEHLGCSRARFDGVLRERGSLISTIEALRGRPRTLEPLNPEIAPALDAAIPEDNIFDPETPVDLTGFVSLLSGDGSS